MEDYNKLVEKNQTGEIDDLEFLLAQEDLAALYVADMQAEGVSPLFLLFLYDPLICKTNGFNHHSQYLRIMICKYKHHVYLLRIPGQTVLFLQPLV